MWNLLNLPSCGVVFNSEEENKKIIHSNAFIQQPRMKTELPIVIWEGLQLVTKERESDEELDLAKDVEQNK